MLKSNEIVKEQIIQTTSKKIVRPSEKKPRACVPHTPYVRTKGFVQATACCLFLNIFFYISVLLLCTFN